MMCCYYLVLFALNLLLFLLYTMNVANFANFSPSLCLPLVKTYYVSGTSLMECVHEEKCKSSMVN